MEGSTLDKLLMEQETSDGFFRALMGSLIHVTKQSNALPSVEGAEA
jgi:hypothetical protein